MRLLFCLIFAIVASLLMWPPDHRIEQGSLNSIRESGYHSAMTALGNKLGLS